MPDPIVIHAMLQGQPVGSFILDNQKKINKIGTSQNADVRIQDPAAEALHAAIEMSPLGVMLIDMGTRSGTFLNGNKVNKSPLRNGDRIVIGSSEFLVTIGSGMFERPREGIGLPSVAAPTGDGRRPPSSGAIGGAPRPGTGGLNSAPRPAIGSGSSQRPITGTSWPAPIPPGLGGAPAERPRSGNLPTPMPASFPSVAAQPPGGTMAPTPLPALGAPASQLAPKTDSSMTRRPSQLPASTDSGMTRRPSQLSGLDRQSQSQGFSPGPPQGFPQGAPTIPSMPTVGADTPSGISARAAHEAFAKPGASSTPLPGVPLVGPHGMPDVATPEAVAALAAATQSPSPDVTPPPSTQGKPQPTLKKTEAWFVQPGTVSQELDTDEKLTEDDPSMARLRRQRRQRQRLVRFSVPMGLFAVALGGYWAYQQSRAIAAADLESDANAATSLTAEELVQLALFDTDGSLESERFIYHYIQKAQSLRDVCDRYYGSLRLAYVVAAANPKVEITTQDIIPPRVARVPRFLEHTVAAEETFDKIAEKLFGTSERGAHIAEVNHGSLEAPPEVGSVIRVPLLQSDYDS